MQMSLLQIFGLKSQIVITAPQYVHLRPPHLGFYPNYIRPARCSVRFPAFGWRRLVGCLAWGSVLGCFLGVGVHNRLAGRGVWGLGCLSEARDS